MIVITLFKEAKTKSKTDYLEYLTDTVYSKD